MSDKSAWIFDPPDASNIGHRSTRNVGINLVAQGIRFVLQMVSTITLARLLTPADFGLVGMVAVLVNFVGLFKDAGLAQATVQRDEITHEQISSLYWINVLLTLGLGAFMLVLTPAIVWIYDDPRLFGLSMVLALPIMISGFGLQHRALLQRHSRFVAIARVEILSFALAVCVGITSALYGLGYWSLAVMTLTMSLANNLGYIGATGWLPSGPKRGTGVRSMLRFGANLTGFNFVNYFARNADNLLIGKFIGAAALGQYSRAYALMMLPISQINAPITNALLPALSSLQNQSEALEELYLKWVRRIAWVTAIPIASGVFWGDSIIILILGSEWQLAGEVFQWLAVAGFLQPVTNLIGCLYTSTGHTSEMLRWGVGSSVIMVIGMLLGLRWGVIGVTVGYSLVVVPICVLGVIYSNRICGISSLRYLRVIYVPLGLAFLIITFKAALII